MHRLVASVEGGLCVTLEHLAVSYFRFILPEINLLFFEMNTTDVGYFIAISNSVISSNKMFRNQDKALHRCRIDTTTVQKGQSDFFFFTFNQQVKKTDQKLTVNTFKWLQKYYISSKCFLFIEES